MTIIIYLGGKYAASHHVIDLVGIATNIQNPAAYTLTLFSKATAYCKLIPTNSFYLELKHQLAQNSYIYIDLAKYCCMLPVYPPIVGATYEAARIQSQMASRSI